MSCQYKDIFGKPNEGIHSYRFAGMAAVDLVMTVIGSYIAAEYFEYSFLIMFLIFMSVGIFLHYTFCVETTLTKKIFKQYNKI